MHSRAHMDALLYLCSSMRKLRPNSAEHLHSRDVSNSVPIVYLCSYFLYLTMCYETTLRKALTIQVFVQLWE